MSDGTVLTDQQIKWTKAIARLLNVELRALTEPASDPPHADHYGEKTAERLGKDILGEKNPKLAIDTKLFREHAESLKNDAASFLGKWEESQDTVRRAKEHVEKEKLALEELKARKEDLLKESARLGREKEKLKNEHDTLAKEFKEQAKDTRYNSYSVDDLLVMGGPNEDDWIKDFRKEISELKHKTESKDEEVAENEKAVKGIRKDISDGMKKRDAAVRDCVSICLPAIDAPANNPEREGILLMLEEYEGTMAKVELDKDSVRSRLADLARLTDQINGWSNRRAEQSLPPPRDALHLAEVVQAEHRRLTEEMIKNDWTPPPPVPGFDNLDPDEAKVMTEVWTGLLSGKGALRLPISEDVGDLVDGLNKRRADEELLRKLAKEREEEKKKLGPFGRLQESDDSSDYDEEIFEEEESQEETEEERLKRERTEELDRKIKLMFGSFKEGDAKPGGTGEATPKKLPTKEEFEKFRFEMCSDIARLMSAPSGREILSEIAKVLEAKPELTLDILPGSDRQCTPMDPDASRGTPKGGSKTGLPEELEPSKGSSCWVGIPCGTKDGDTLAHTENGNMIVAPTQVILGHELVHAMHDLTGTGRKLPESVSKSGEKDRLEKAGLSKTWTNFEEYWTIVKGDLSEQSIRQDYQLSAERFGHGAIQPDEDLIAKALETAEASHEIDNFGREEVEKALVARGFTEETIGQMADSVRLDLFKKEEIRGPLPKGWSPARLDTETIGRICADKLAFKLDKLGWTAYGLPYDGDEADPTLGFPKTLKAITEGDVHHPRSTKGRRFSALGGMRALKALEQLAAQRKDLGLGKPDNDHWPALLAYLEAAVDEVNKALSSSETLDKGLGKSASLLNKIEALLGDR